MPIRVFQCTSCDRTIRTLKDQATCLCGSHMAPTLTAPEAKFMEPKDPLSKDRGKSQMKNQEKILKERAKLHSQETEYHEFTQEASFERARRNKWVGSDGRIRKRIDNK